MNKKTVSQLGQLGFTAGVRGTFGGSASQASAPTTTNAARLAPVRA